MSLSEAPATLQDNAATSKKPFVYYIPVIGAIAKEWAEGDPDFPFLLIAAALLLWACALMLWGLPALFLPAVAFTPVMLLLLVLISRG